MVALSRHLLPTSTDTVQVIHGANSGLFTVAGVAVGTVRAFLTDAFSIPYFVVPFVKGTRVGVRHVLAAGDVLEFVRIVGVKGSDRLPFHEAVAHALLEQSPELQAIAAELHGSPLDRDAAIDHAILLVTKHFLTTYGPLDREARKTAKALADLLVGPLASVAADVRRIADKFDLPPAEVVGTRESSQSPAPARQKMQTGGRDGHKWYSIEEAASLSGRSVSTIRRDIRAGILLAHIVGRGRRRPSYRIRRADLKAYIQAGRAEPPDPPAVPTTTVRKKSRHFD